MKLLRKLICIFFLVTFLFNYCCSQKRSKNASKNTSNTWELSVQSASPLEMINKRDTLLISFQDVECGEWGGHQEIIYLQRQSNNKIAARIVIDTVPCDDIIEKNGVGILNPEKREIILDYTKVLELKDQQVFSDFLQRLLQLYLKSLVIGNYGSYYQVKNTDNSLYFRYWNSGNLMDTHYSKLKKEVFGELR